MARDVRALGHEVFAAFRDSSYTDAARREGIETFIAPLLRTPSQINPSPLNFSDVLLNLGFHDPKGLAGALWAWRSTFEMLAPDLLIAEYAPTALLAARLEGLRRVTTGAGFSQPPLRNPLPAFRTWIPTDPQVLRAIDEHVLASIRDAAGAARARLPERALEIFDADAHLVCTFAEIDPYAPRDGVEHLGPPRDPTTSAPSLQWQSEGARVFAYLKPRNPRFDAVLAGLAALDAECVVAAPGLEPERASAACTASMRVVPGPVDLAPLIAGATLCVSHAGAGIAARAMVAGVPMALLPLHLEQFLMARRIAESGSALISTGEDPLPDFAQWFGKIIGDAAMREAAARLAARHRGFSFERASERAAQRISELAAQ